MKLLAVETATARLSVAVLDGECVLGRADEDARGAHARLLVPAIDRVFQLCGLTLHDMNGLAVSIGPGSFTSLRVGLATMLGFRLATDLPLAVVPTLEAMAWNLRGEKHALCPVLRARTGEVYWAQYQWLSNGTLTQLQEERTGSVESVATTLRGPVVMFGDGWQLHRGELEKLVERQRAELHEAPAEASFPSAVSVSLSGLRRLQRGEVVARGIAPVYVQRPEAEVVWEKRGLSSPLAKAARSKRKARTRVS